MHKTECLKKMLFAWNISMWREIGWWNYIHSTGSVEKSNSNGKRPVLCQNFFKCKLWSWLSIEWVDSGLGKIRDER